MATRELEVRATADTSDLQRGMKDASQSIEGVEVSTQKAQGGVSRGSAMMAKGMSAVATGALAAAAAAAAAGAALVALGARGMKASDEQAKLARQLGITNAELATLQRAGEFAGLSSGQLTNNMERLTRAMGEAATTGGRSAEAFDRLGINVEDLMGMRADEQMAALAEGMGQLGSRAEQAAVAQDLFGRSGQQMLVFLDDAEGNLERARTQVDAFGLALSEVETSRIEAANDAMSSIGAVIQGVANRIASRVAPLIEFLALKFEEVAIETNGFQSIVDGVFTFVIKAAGFVANAIEGIRRAFAAIKHAVTVMGNAVVQIFTWNVNVITGFVDTAVDALNVIIDGANKVASIIGAEIPRAGRMAESGFVQSIRGLAAQTEQEVEESRANLDEIMGAPWPSDAIEQFLSDLDKIEDRAETVQRSFVPAPPPTEPEGEGAEAGNFDQELQALREFLMSEGELLSMRFEQRRELLATALEEEAIQKQEHDELMLELEAQYNDEVEKMRLRSLSQIEKFQAQSWHRQTAQVLGELADLTSGLDRSNKVQFEIMRSGAIARAAVNTYEGISRSLSAYPMPLAGIMAAAHAAAGFAQVHNIANQSFGQGANGGGGGTQPIDAPMAEAERQERRLIVQGIDSGSMFTGEVVRNLMDEISQAQQDGYQVVI